MCLLGKEISYTCSAEKNAYEPRLCHQSITNYHKAIQKMLWTNHVQITVGFTLFWRPYTYFVFYKNLHIANIANNKQKTIETFTISVHCPSGSFFALEKVFIIFKISIVFSISSHLSIYITQLFPWDLFSRLVIFLAAVLWYPIFLHLPRRVKFVGRF